MLKNARTMCKSSRPIAWTNPYHEDACEQVTTLKRILWRKSEQIRSYVVAAWKLFPRTTLHQRGTSNFFEALTSFWKQYKLMHYSRTMVKQPSTFHFTWLLCESLNIQFELKHNRRDHTCSMFVCSSHVWVNCGLRMTQPPARPSFLLDFGQRDKEK